MSVVGEASVKIIGDLKPLMSSFDAAKKAVTAFDKQMNSSAKKVDKVFKSLANNRVKIDYSAVTKMNQSLDASQRRIDKINKSVIRPKTNMPEIKLPKIGNTGLEGFNEQLKSSTSNVSAFGTTFNRVFAGVGAYLGTRELIRYADTWTRMGNQIAAAGQVAGRSARSLQELNNLANQSRSGIEETVNLYARMMRSTAGVAKSEREVAQATDTVNKAFKAGGAAASEQAAGIMQLGQALGSGFLQGDELRSLRENAPLLASAIAKEFETNIAGLKALGAEGKLTTDRVFKAILNAQKGIDEIYATTSSTIADGITRVRNALTQYIGEADQSMGATAIITSALTKLADNMNSVADVAFKFAAVLAGIFVGRSFASMATNIGMMGSQLIAFTNSLRAASAVAGTSAIAWGSLGAALGPLAAIIGGLASVALYSYISSSAEAENRTASLNAEMIQLGILTADTAKEVENAAEKLNNLSAVEVKRRLSQIRDEVEALTNSWWLLSKEGDLSSVISSIQSAGRAWSATTEDFKASAELEKTVKALAALEISGKEAQEVFQRIRDTDVSQSIIDALDKAEKFEKQLTANLTLMASYGEIPGMNEVNAQFDSLINNLEGFQRMGFLTEEQKKSLEEAIKEIKETGTVTDTTREAINKLNGINPNLGGFFQSLDGAISRMIHLTGLVEGLNTVKIETPETMGPSAEPFFQKKATDEWIAAQKTSSSLSDREYKLAKHRETIRKQAASDEISITEEQVNQLALAKLAGEEARKNERAEAAKTKREANKTKKTKLDDYQKEQRSIEESIALMQAEQEILAMYDPLINDYGFAMAKAETAQKLLSDAKRAGLAVAKEELDLQRLLQGDFAGLTKEARAQAEAIYFAADAYAAATANGNQLKETNKEIAKEYETIREAGRESMTGLVSDLVKGKSAAEALENALGKLADALLKVGLDILFGASGSGGFGVLGSLLGFSDGGYTGDGAKYEPKGVVHGGEYVFSKKATNAIGINNLESLHRSGKRGYANGGYVGVPNSSLSRTSGSIGGSQQVDVSVGVRNYVDEDGNWQAKVQEISYKVSSDVTESGLTQFNNALPDRMQQINANPRRRTRGG